MGRGSPEWWAAELRQEIERSTRRRIPGHGLVAAHLSGGLDSSAVVVFAASVLAESHRPLEAISFSAPPDTQIGGSFPVDADVIAAVCDRTGVVVHHPEVALLSFEHTLALAAPGMMPPPYSTSTVHRWAAERGMRTILSGWGGDEGVSFNGRSHLAELVAHGRVVSLARQLRALRAKGQRRGRSTTSACVGRHRSCPTPWCGGEADPATTPWSTEPACRP